MSSTCHLVCMDFSVHPNLKNYACSSFTSFSIQCSRFTRRIHKLYAKNQWRNYYGLRPGEPGGPNPNGPNGGPPGSGCRLKNIGQNLSPKSGKWHFRDSCIYGARLVHIRCSTHAFCTSTRGEGPSKF